MFIFYLIAYMIVNGEIFQQRMVLCVSRVHDDGHYYRTKRVAEVVVYMLTKRCAIIWT
jgi:hypothetical protein